MLNKYSSIITKDHDFPGAQVAMSREFVSNAVDIGKGDALRRWRPGPADNEE